ncbi:MAG: hypothetical protein WAZ18_02195 [Alphaproteobacteria bacterium]
MSVWANDKGIVDVDDMRERSLEYSHQQGFWDYAGSNDLSQQRFNQIVDMIRVHMHAQDQTCNPLIVRDVTHWSRSKNQRDKAYLSGMIDGLQSKLKGVTVSVVKQQKKTTFLRRPYTKDFMVLTPDQKQIEERPSVKYEVEGHILG